MSIRIIMIALFCGLFAPVVHAASVFAPAELRKGVAAFIEMRPGDEELSDDLSQREMADGLSELIAQLRPSEFNDLVADLMSDYVRNPAHRESLDMLMLGIWSNTLDELKRAQEESPYFTVLDDVLTVVTVFYSIEYGSKAVAKYGGRFGGRLKEVVASFVSKMPKSAIGKNAIVIGTGGAVGATHAVLASYKSRKVDARAVLYRTQDEVVNEIARRAVLLRDRVKSASELQTLIEEVSYFQQAAPRLSGVIEPIVQDIQEIRASPYASGGTRAVEYAADFN